MKLCCREGRWRRCTAATPCLQSKLRKGTSSPTVASTTGAGYHSSARASADEGQGRKTGGAGDRPDISQYESPTKTGGGDTEMGGPPAEEAGVDKAQSQDKVRGSRGVVGLLLRGLPPPGSACWLQIPSLTGGGCGVHVYRSQSRRGVTVRRGW